MSRHPKPNGGKPYSGPNQNRAPKDKCDASGGVEIRGVVETKISPDAAKKHDAAEERKEAREERRFLVEVLTLIFIIIYAGITFLMYRANNRSADAAKSAADTAKETLHVAERAYLSISAPSYDSKNTITFQLVNTGHLTAEDVKLKVYRLAVPPISKSGSNVYQLSDVIDFGKDELEIPAIPNMQSGLPNIISAVFDNLDTTRTGINGTELIVGGFVDYGDGFEYEARKNSSFCIRTEWVLKVGEQAVASCNINDYLPILKALISRKDGER